MPLQSHFRHARVAAALKDHRQHNKEALNEKRFVSSNYRAWVCCFGDLLRTSAWGINPGGVIVGDYLDRSRVSHGFLLSEGHYVTVDVPGSLIGLTGTLPT